MSNQIFAEGSATAEKLKNTAADKFLLMHGHYNL